VKIRLLYADRDAGSQGASPEGWEGVLAFCGAESVVKLMAGADVGLAQACRKALLHPLAQATEVAYRQDAVRDALAHPDAVRHLFALAQGEATRSVAERPECTFTELVQIAGLYRKALEELGGVARELRSDASSVAFRRFCDEAAGLADQSYLRAFDDLLKELGRTKSAFMSVELDPTGEPHFTLRAYPRRTDWIRWKVSGAVSGDAASEVQERDRRARLAHAQEELRPELWRMLAGMGRFFRILRDEVGFYVGCINLADALEKAGVRWCLPSVNDALDVATQERSCEELSCIGENGCVNVLEEAKGKGMLFWIVEGKKGSGKTTLLAAWCQAQVMAQAGFPVCAAEMSLPVRSGIQAISSHGRDATCLEEEFTDAKERLSSAAEGSLIFWDDPFKGLSQGEAAQILQEAVRALTEAKAEVVLATDNALVSANNLARRGVFHIRCEKDGQRFSAIPGRPRKDSSLADAFKEVFGEELGEAAGLGR